jgi:37-kD nucleoid-associated bacterial protein
LAGAERVCTVKLGALRIDKLIVHVIPVHKAGDQQGESPILSEIESALGQNLLNLFSERIRTSLNRRYAYEVVRDISSDSPVPELAETLLRDTSGLVPHSQAMATRLHESQPGISPAGLLVVGLSRADEAPALTVCKLEHEDAIRVRETTVDGARTFDVEHLRDLMLGKNTKVFKASVFTAPDGSLDGLVSDDQSAYREDGSIATFWLRRFLGCMLKTAADVATERFFTATQAWINSLEDPEAKARYEIALLAQMNSEAKTITPTQFAEQNLAPQHRDAFRNALTAAAAPSTRFTKDLRLVEPRIRRVAATFEEFDGRLLATPEGFKRFVRVPEGQARGPVEIHDRLKGMHGAR